MTSFKKAHQIAFNEVCTEGGDVYEETIADWFAKLKYLYHTETAYNGKKILVPCSSVADTFHHNTINICGLKYSWS
jgi:hypothetical protein